MICEGCLGFDQTFNSHTCRGHMRLTDNDGDTYYQKCACAVETRCANWSPIQVRKTA